MNPLILIAMVFNLFAPPAFAAAETKRVCVEQVDPKTKQPKQVCREVKTHKKLEGTKVPDKTAK